MKKDPTEFMKGGDGIIIPGGGSGGIEGGGLGAINDAVIPRGGFTGISEGTGPII